MNFQNVQFVKSVASTSALFNYDLPEVLFIGRSNVGKSSLINALTTSKRLAYVSKRPGHTKLLNFYRVDNNLMLVDAPGYGFVKGNPTHYEEFEVLLGNYFKNQRKLKTILFLLDSRRIPTEDDVLFYNYAKSLNLPVTFVITKVDKVNQSERAKITKNIISVIPDYLDHEIIYVSSHSQKGIDVLRSYLNKIA